jgi:hypothetical protein
MPELTEAEIELKKYEARMALWRTGVLGGLATILVAIVSGLGTVIVSSLETTKELHIQELRLNHELRLNDIKVSNNFVISFLETALDDNIERRRRFSEYLSIMAASSEQRERWKEYHGVVHVEYLAVKAELERLERQTLEPLRPTTE